MSTRIRQRRHRRRCQRARRRDRARAARLEGIARRSRARSSAASFREIEFAPGFRVGAARARCGLSVARGRRRNSAWAPLAVERCRSRRRLAGATTEPLALYRDIARTAQRACAPSRERDAEHWPGFARAWRSSRASSRQLYRLPPPRIDASTARRIPRRSPASAANSAALGKADMIELLRTLPMAAGGSGSTTGSSRIV